MNSHGDDGLLRLLSALFKEPLKDERSDDEEGEEDTTEKVKAE